MVHMTICKTVFLNQLSYEIENEFYKAIILPEEGCNLISLFDKEKKIEILHTPNSYEQYEKRKMVYGIPVLIPPNRIDNATFSFEGRRYYMELNRVRENERNHIHGFVHDKKWNLEYLNQHTNEIVFILRSDDYSHITKQYPHSFTLTMKFMLTDNGIIQTLLLENHDTKNIPLGIGYHTTFHFDNHLSELQMDLGKQWVFGKNFVPTGELVYNPLQEELKIGTHLTDKKLDDEFFMTQNKTAIIKHPHLGVNVHYTADNSFNHWVLFTADGISNMLSIEPYSWITNAPNLSLPNEVTGLYVLKPKETKKFQTEIKVEKI